MSTHDSQASSAYSVTPGYWIVSESLLICKSNQKLTDSETATDFLGPQITVPKADSSAFVWISAETLITLHKDSASTVPVIDHDKADKTDSSSVLDSTVERGAVFYSSAHCCAEADE